MRRLRKLLLAMVVMGVCAVGAVAAEKLILVTDGAPAAHIVIAAEYAGGAGDRAADGNDPAAWAAQNVWDAAMEFQHYVEKMSGVRLPIVTDDQDVAGPLVLVGKSRLTDQILQLDVPAGRTKNLQDEGFVIWCKGDRLVLAGNDTPPYRGTRYAVCEMLNRLGVRWFMPGEFGEVVPAKDAIAVEEMVIRESPSFPIRDYWAHGRRNMPAEEKEWKIHNKMNPGIAGWYGVPGDGSVVHVLPPQDVFAAHPEWFALERDGTRNPHMPCMTNPEMIQYVAENIKEKARKGAWCCAFSADDGTPRCYCANCQKMASGFDGYGANLRDPMPEASITTEWIYFVSRVMDEVNKEFPDFVISTNGYANRDIPPELPPELGEFNKRGNLVIMFANICACTIHGYEDEHCWQMERQGQMVRRWCKLCDKVWRYGYNYTMLVSKGTLTPMVHRERVVIPLLKKWGLWGFQDQDEGDWSLTGVPTRIVRARLEWDADTDVDAFLDDYFAKWYGPAGEPVKAFYAALEDAFATSREHGHEDVILPQIYTDELLEKLGASIREAEQLAQSDAEKIHVRMDRLMYDYLVHYVAFEHCKQACDYARGIEHADRMLAINQELGQITDFMGYRPYPVYDMAWRRLQMLAELRKTSGPEGDLLVVLPEEARFCADPHDDGIFARWMEPEFDDAGWRTMRTTAGWQSQGLQDDKGRPYTGLAWYRFNVEVPQTDRQVALYAPAIVNEAWVWVNGGYAGHRPFIVQWSRPQLLEMDLSPLIRPGRTNQITLRVLCNTEVFGVNGIYNRMFLYARDGNPIARMAEMGAGAPPVIEKAGARTIEITPVPVAGQYQVWMGPNEDGRDARPLVRNPRPADDIPELPAGKVIYLFASYDDEQDRISKPSAPFAVDLRPEQVEQQR